MNKKPEGRKEYFGIEGAAATMNAITLCYVESRSFGYYEKMTWQRPEATKDKKKCCKEFVKPICSISKGIDLDGNVHSINIEIDDIQLIVNSKRLIKLFELFAGVEKLRFELQGDWEPDCDNRIFFTIGFDYWQNLQSQAQTFRPRTDCYEAIYGKWQKEEYCQQAINLFGDLIKEVLR